ncbi:leucine-rich repeats and immunoglobulin-like domains protein 3 [Mytilus edulis]|uniref:leucine-rich repeats and immunoglobulin-like domains protein 3 n=1 Tax=Mytilus edulis TaxID=6550 RepID=UPI0039EF4A10
MAIVYLFYLCIIVNLGGFTEIGTLAENLRCPSQCSCLGNFVDCSRQGLIAVPKDLPIWVTRLEVQYNAISELRSEDFRGLKNLTLLDVSNNEIKFLNGSVLEHLSGLQQLKLNHNKLTEFPKLIALPSLLSIEANHNRITFIAQEFCLQMPQLKAIEMNNNYITDISPGVFPVNNVIHKINLNNNRLETLESGCLDNLTSIEVLKMNKNRIDRIPKKLFDKLTQLKTLEITKNRLSRLDGMSFKNLIHLQTLKLRKNTISTMNDATFFGLKELNTLQLDHNNITTVSSKWLYDLKSLKEISLHHNKITKIEANSWQYCPKLVKLDMSHNKLKAIVKESFKNLMAANILLLKNNNIQNIEEGSFHDLVFLTELELSNNELSWTIEDMNGTFSELHNLESLSLENNKIKSIAKNAFNGLIKVKTLNLLNNEISTIQSNAFETMVEMDSLKFYSTNFLCDCKLAWLSQWLMAKKFEKSVTASCQHPDDLEGKSIFSIDPELFKCDGNTLKPVISISPISRKAVQGDNITLTCEAVSTKDSDTQFNWKKDNILLLNPLTENKIAKDDTKIIRYSSKLHLYELKDGDSGVYQCVILNSFGPAYSMKASIEVHVFPHFSKKPFDVTVKVGSAARLECSATGRPNPTISWSKNGGDDFPAARERRMHVMPDDNIFYILDVTKFDEGTYTCTAKNDAGSISANLNLTVLQIPAFVRPMERIKKTQEGGTTVIECMAEGIPKPRLTWYKSNKPLESNQQRYFFTADNQLLIIVQTQASDAGEYKCNMTNTLGHVSGVSKLVVFRGDKQISVDPKPGPLITTPSDESTTTGIIIIAVVCCVVGTSLVWVIIIYQTRKRHEMYSATPTDETTLPCEVAGQGYQPYPDGGTLYNGPMTVQGYPYQDYQIQESGYESSSGQYRAPRPAIFPSDVDEEENNMTAQLTFHEHKNRDNSDSDIHYPNSETDSMKSSQSTSSTHTSGHQTLQTFRPILSNSNTFVNRTQSQSDSCENCEKQRHSSSADMHSCSHKQSIHSIPIPNGVALHHGSLPQPPGYASLRDSSCVICNCDNEVSGCTSQLSQTPPYSDPCNHHTKVPSSPNGPHTSCHNSSNTPDTGPEKSPPAIPPKQHKHSHSNIRSLPNGVHLMVNGSVVNGAVDI